MRIYEHHPSHLVRIHITKINDTPQYLTFCETTPIEVEDFIRSIIEAEKLSPFHTGHRTRIDIRESWGGKNGKSKSLSFKGLDTKSTLELILNNMNGG